MIKRFLRSPSSYQRLIVIAGILPILFLGLISYYTIKEGIVDTSEIHLHSVNTVKKAALQKFFLQHKLNLEKAREEITVLYADAKERLRIVQEKKKALIQDYFDDMSAQLVQLSQKMLLKNIFQVREKQNIFSSMHEEMLHDMAKELSVNNIYLLDNEGKIVVDTDRRERIGQDIGAVAYTLKKAWKIAKTKPYDGVNSVVFSDFAQDAATHEYKAFALVAFEDISGYVVVEFDKKRLNTIVQNRMGTFHTMESYLVGERDDKTWLRSDRVLEAEKLGDLKSSKLIKKGLNGLSGVESIVGTSGEVLLNAYDPLGVQGLNWTLQTTVSMEEAITAKRKKKSYFQTFMQEHGYHDLFLVATDGHISYTVRHEAEYNTNILNGNFRNSNFADMVKRTLQTKKFSLTDYQAYGPAHNNPVAFMAVPLLSEKEDIELIIAVQLLIDPINEIMTVRKDMGDSGESFLVGSDHLMRSDSYLDAEHRSVRASFESIDEGSIYSADVQKALQGLEGVEVTTDYRGIEVLSSYMPFEMKDIRWALITKMDIREIEKPLQQLKIRTIVNVLIFMFLAYLLLTLISRERKKHDKELQQFAFYDMLTGLPNRVQMTERLEQAIERLKQHDTKVAVLLIDLDRFKYINDSFGHPVGDEVLKTVAGRIRDTVKTEDMVSRIGGDEFIVIMENLKERRPAAEMANKIIEAIAPVIEDETGRRFHVGCSIGISISTDDSRDKDVLIKYADSAMFMAKEDGRNTYMFYQEKMTDEAVEQITLISDLRQAIEEKQFVLHYQPKIDLKTRKVTSVEALVRWEHPTLGLVPPYKFIPIAETTGLINDIGSWVFDESCQSFVAWKKAGYDLESIAVNFSTQQLQCEGCSDTIAAIMKANDFDPDWLELEITETTVIDNLELTRRNMDKLRQMGIELAIDDFGTGYSSLAYLKQLPVATIKIDRSFIRDIPEDPNDIVIVRAIIAIAKTLEYKVVAEGVETKEQLDILIEEECDIVQGYYFAKPMPEEALLKYLDSFDQ